MIFSENNKPSFDMFADLMRRTDEVLNREAIGRESYYAKRNSEVLEEDIVDALDRCAKDTPFEGTIQRISGSHFPDIVANRFFGVEVKSTKKDSWKSTGSSILESTRVEDVERIFLTFGKLGAPVKFLSRPYEECLCDIAVTHYPRYKIDMLLQKGQTIFDKLNIPYDELRSLPNPVAPVSKYYKDRLKQGETLWWSEDSEVSSPPIIRLWKTLEAEEKDDLLAKGYALFPEILGNSSDKYENYALWLVKECGIVATNIRDQFSAGGKKDVSVNGVTYNLPNVFHRIQKQAGHIMDMINDTDEEQLIEHWAVQEIEKDRICQWCLIAANYASKSGELEFEVSRRVLSGMFFSN